MSERFIITITGEYKDLENDEWLTLPQIIDTLNQLNEKHNQLKKELASEKLKKWRLINHLKNIGWQETYIHDITDNTWNTLDINFDFKDTCSSKLNECNINLEKLQRDICKQVFYKVIENYPQMDKKNGGGQFF